MFTRKKKSTLGTTISMLAAAVLATIAITVTTFDTKAKYEVVSSTATIPTFYFQTVSSKQYEAQPEKAELFFIPTYSERKYCGECGNINTCEVQSIYIPGKINKVLGSKV